MSIADVKQTGDNDGKIGVLNLQGDVFEHLDHLERIGIRGVPVKVPEECEQLAGLIIPGGESTCLARLMRIFGFDEVIVRRRRAGMKLWGTCAGAILLASNVRGESAHLALIDMEIERNSFGSQLDSFVCEGFAPKVSAQPIPLTFIRAPKILSVGPGVEILLQMDSFLAAVESPDVLATVFHPELTPSLAFHRYFAKKCGLSPLLEEPGALPVWNRNSWMRMARIA